MGIFGAREERTHIENIRKSLPAVQEIVYMNTGTMGPLALSTSEAILKTQQEELNYGRISVSMSDLVKKRDKARNEARESIAKLINADVEEIALTANTSEGINHIIWGFKWKQEDEVLALGIGMEHIATLLPLYTLQSRYGVCIKIASNENPLKELKEQISSKVRLIAMSHVLYSTGELLPVEEIIQLAHQHGIPVLLDGAQAVGAIPVDVKNLNVDFYSIPGQKWLCGPEGTGALYIKKERLTELSQTYIGYNSIELLNAPDYFRTKPNAQRFEVASSYLPSIVGQKISIDWLVEEVGLKWMFKRISELSQIARKELGGLPGIKIITPKEAAGLLSFRAEGISPQKLVGHLGAEGIAVRAILEMGYVRVSIGFFNTEDEIEKLVKCIAEIMGNAVQPQEMKQFHKTDLNHKFFKY